MSGKNIDGKSHDAPIDIICDINDPNYDESLIPSDKHAQKVKEKAAEDSTL